MDRVEKFLMLGVLGIALAIVAVLAFETDAREKRSGEKDSSIVDTDLEGRQPPDPDATSPNAAEDGPAARSLKGLLGDNTPANLEVAEGPGDGDAKPAPGSEGTDALGGPAKKALTLDGDLFQEPAQPSADVTPSMYWYDSKYRAYTVRSGDTLDGILLRHCGYAGPKTRRRIEMLNEGLNLHRLRAGAQILLPVELLKGSLASLDRPREASASDAGTGERPSSEEPRARSESSSAGAPEAPLPEDSGRSYQIQPGDSLWKIAKREVGNSQAYAYVKKMEKLNADLLARTGGILPRGKELRLPAK